MSISDNYVPDVSTGNGVTVAFSGSWNVIASAYFVCQLKNIATGALTDLDVPGSDGTLAFTSSGYTATLNVAPSSAYQIVRSRNITKDQNTPYKTSLGFQGLVEENSFDKVTAISQDIQEQMNRAPKVAIGSSTVPVLGAPTINAVIYWSDANTISASNIDITTFNTNVSAAATSAAAAATSQSAASGSATSASGSASTATAQAVIATAQAVIATAKAVLTAADRVQTGLDVTSANSSATTATTQAGLAATAKTACDSDKTACDADVVLTHADVVLTHADVVTTGNNVTTTNTNVTSTATNATAAAASATAAAASAASGLYHGIVDKTFSDSPIIPLLATNGNLYRIDTSGGNVVVNLGILATYATNMTLAFVKTTADANTITVNRGGTDTISGGTSVVITTEYEVHVLVGETSSGKWLDTVQTTGIADGAVTTAKLADGAVTETKMTLADNTTGNVSTSAHGFAPKAPNDVTKFLNGTGAYSVPVSATSGGSRALSGTDTVIASDNGKLLTVSGTCALALTAAATVGSFTCFVKNTATTGIQIITITPNGAENLDGANSTLVILPGEMRSLSCNATAWTTAVIEPFTLNCTTTASPTLPRNGYTGIIGQLWGGGASGGAGATNGGGGGGGGGFNQFTFLGAVSSLAMSLTIGAGGNSQTSANTAGNAGGTTSVQDTTNTRYFAFAYGGGAGGGSSLGAGGGGGGTGNNAAGAPNVNGTPNTSGVGGNAVTTTAGAGGQDVITGSFGGAGGSPGPNAGGGGGGNSTTKLGGWAYYGGGAGGCAVATTGGAGGQTLWGGGGGGGASNATAGAGGISTFGGNGGAGAASGTATSGSTPGGGGGGIVGTGGSGAGGGGKIILRGVI